MNLTRYTYPLLCLALVVALAACEAGIINTDPTAEGVQVTGVGSVYGDPDIAVLSLGVAAEEPTVAEANEAAAYAMQQVLDSLKTNGIAESDIQTRHFSIRPVYSYTNNQQVLRGYEVSNTVSAKVRDIDNTGKIIDDVVTAGGKWTRVNSIGFAIDDPSGLEEQARVEAMKDAKSKAQTLAELGGVELGKPLSISESAGGVTPVYRYEDAVSPGGGASTPIEPGELEVTISVVVIYDIE